MSARVSTPNIAGTPACVASKVQVVLQFEVCRGRSEVFLSILGRLYLSEVVSEFDAGTLPVRGARLQQRLLLAESLQPLLLGVRRHLVLELRLFD